MKIYINEKKWSNGIIDGKKCVYYYNLIVWAYKIPSKLLPGKGGLIKAR